MKQVLLFLLAALPGLAFAGVADFDGLPAGTIVTNQLAANGVLFTPSGSALSSRVPTSPVDFLLPATNVSFLAGDGDAAADEFRVTFFDAALTQILQQTFATGVAGVNVNCPGCTVGRIQIQVLAPASAPGSGMRIDDLNYDAVPEPATTAMVTGGLLAVALRRLRRR